jgi:hypothetical protein
MKKLFERPNSTGRFHESDAIHALSPYLLDENYREPVANEMQDFVKTFETDTVVLQHSFNEETTTM